MSMPKVKVRGQRSRSQRSWPHLAVSGLWLQFEFTYGDEMMHKAWCCLEEVPYCFSRSSVKFQGHTAKKKSKILSRIGRFRTVTPVWIHQWLWNDSQSLKQHRRGALLFFKVISQISRSHATRLKNRRFWPKLGVSGLQLQFEFINGYEMMRTPWSNIGEVPYFFSR